MNHQYYHSKDSDRKTLKKRSLRLEPLEARCLLSATTVTASASTTITLYNAALANKLRNLDADGSISRTDMIALLRVIQSERDGAVDARDLQDLRTIVYNSSALRMKNYVKVLASDVVNGNYANAHYKGSYLGNLAVGSSNVKLGKLVDKWFYGKDLPYTGGYGYAKATGTLYSSSGPSHYSEKQGYLGDCYLISALGSIADRSQTAIKRMFIGNGDGTWTVRFFYNGKADYVTVNRLLPIDGYGGFIFQGYGAKYYNANNALWLGLLEKAYAQWNETGKTLQGTYNNSYKGIEGGWMGDVYKQALGSCTTYAMQTSASNARSSMIYDLKVGQAVTVATNSSTNFNNTGLYSNHAYNVLSYNGTTGRFKLYNPWGSNQPKQLTWTQLARNAGWFAATKTASIPAGIAVQGAVAKPLAELPSVAMTTTVGAFDSPAAEPRMDASVARAAVDAVFTDWGAPKAAAPAGNASQQVAATLPPVHEWLSDATLGSMARTFGDGFAEVDASFESIQSHVALAL